MKRSFFVAFSLACGIAMLSGCHKETDTTTQTSNDFPSNAPSTDDPAKVAEQKAQEEVQTGLSVPDDQYFNLDNGIKCLNLYSRVKGEIPSENYADIIDIKRTMSTNDRFKRDDIIKSLKPQIDTIINQDKGGKYFYVVVKPNGNTQITHYIQQTNPNTNTQEHGFQIIDIGDEGGHWFDDNGNNCTLNLKGSSKYSWVTVDDESKARAIESSVSSNTTKFKVFAVADDTAYRSDDPDKIPSVSVSGTIVKIDILDDKNNVLLSMTPKNSHR